MALLQKLFERQELETKEITEVSTPFGRHYKTPFGTFPSVTNVLSKKDNSSLDEWRERVGAEEAERISKEATNRGSMVHDLIERYLRGEPIQFKHPTLKAHFFQIKPILDKFTIIYANEIPLYSKYLKVAGRCDCVAMLDGEVQIIDFKTSKHYKEEDQIHSYNMQCSAYSFMLKEMYGIEVNKFTIIISNMYENKYSVFEGKPKRYLRDFWELRQKWNDLISTNS